MKSFLQELRGSAPELLERVHPESLYSEEVSRLKLQCPPSDLNVDMVDS